MSCHGCPIVAVQSIQSGLPYHVDMRSCLYHLVMVKARRQTSQPVTTVAETSFGLHNDWLAQSAPTTLISRRPYCLIPPYTSTPKQPNTPLNLTSAPPDHIRPHPQPHSQTPSLDTTFKRDLRPLLQPQACAPTQSPSSPAATSPNPSSAPRSAQPHDQISTARFSTGTTRA